MPKADISEELRREDERLNLSRRKFFFFGSLFLAKPEIVRPEAVVRVGDRIYLRLHDSSQFPGGYVEILHDNGRRQKYPLSGFRAPVNGRIVSVMMSTPTTGTLWLNPELARRSRA